MRMDGAFRALLILLVGIVSAEVPPPENVSASCQNAAVTVNWNYPEHQPKTRFRVFVSINGNKVLDDKTTDHHYDLTNFVWNIEKYYLEYLFVQVTALQGNNQSENVRSNSFSFDEWKVVDTKCYLDFPPVEIYMNMDTEMAVVSFTNPIINYKDVKRTFRAGSEPTLSFSVSPVRNGTKYLGDISSHCSAKDATCKVDVPLHKDEELCVTLNGHFFDSNGIGKVMFRETNETCALDSPGNVEEIMAVILTAVVVFVIIVAVILICKVKAWTIKPSQQKTSQQPISLILPKKTQQDQRLKYAIVRNEDISKVSIGQPSKRSSTTSDDSDQSQSRRVRGTSLNPGYCEGAFNAQRHLSENSNQTDSDSADYSVKTDFVSVESEGEEIVPVSGYDCPHVHTVDMGNGDMATGYGN